MNYLVHGEMYGIVYSNDFLMHEGVAKRSGRYPYGSGKRPFQHTGRVVSSGVSKVVKKAKKRFSAEGRAKAATKKYKEEAKIEKAKKSAIEAKEEAKRQKEARKALQKSNKEVKKHNLQLAKNASALSDDELQKQIDRLTKEKRLKDLTNETSHTKVTNGQKYMNDVLKSAGKTVLTTALVGLGTYAINKSLTGAAKNAANPQTAKTLNEIAAAMTKKKDK